MTLSSTVPTDFPLSALRLPRTAFGDDFDLLASRARCKGEPIESAHVRSRGRVGENPQRARNFFARPHRDRLARMRLARLLVCRGVTTPKTIVGQDARSGDGDVQHRVQGRGGQHVRVADDVLRERAGARNAGSRFKMASGTGTCVVRYDQAGDATRTRRSALRTQRRRVHFVGSRRDLQRDGQLHGRRRHRAHHRRGFLHRDPVATRGRELQRRAAGVTHVHDREDGTGDRLRAARGEEARFRDLSASGWVPQSAHSLRTAAASAPCALRGRLRPNAAASWRRASALDACFAPGRGSTRRRPPLSGVLLSRPEVNRPSGPLQVTEGL